MGMTFSGRALDHFYDALCEVYKGNPFIRDGDQVYIMSDKMDIKISPRGNVMFDVNIKNYFKGEETHGYSESFHCSEDGPFTISFGEIILRQKVFFKHGE